MPKKPRPSGPERFARDFTVLVAQEAMAAGRRRVCRPGKFVRWAEQSLRSSRGDLERLADSVGHKLWRLVYGASARKAEKDRCRKKALVFARRHRLVLAEQVLASNVAEDREPPAIRPPKKEFVVWPWIGKLLAECFIKDHRELIAEKEPSS